MVVIEQTVTTHSGTRYHVENKGDESVAWCEEVFGKPKFANNGRWFPLVFTIMFRDKKDRDWYILRWL